MFGGLFEVVDVPKVVEGVVCVVEPKDEDAEADAEAGMKDEASGFSVVIGCACCCEVVEGEESLRVRFRSSPRGREYMVVPLASESAVPASRSGVPCVLSSRSSGEATCVRGGPVGVVSASPSAPCSTC